MEPGIPERTFCIQNEWDMDKFALVEANLMIIVIYTLTSNFLQLRYLQQVKDDKSVDWFCVPAMVSSSDDHMRV